RVGHNIHYRRSSPGLLDYYGLRTRYKDLQLGLKGRFQYRNAALALLALEILKGKGLTVSDEAIRLGLADLMWPGRLERVSSDPTIILDGAHNPSAMRSLAYAIENDFDFDQLILVLGVMEDKDISSILKEILPLANRVIYTRPTYYRAADPQYLMDMAKGFGRAGEAHFSIPEAVDRARTLAEKRDLILITGSLFTVGEVKSYLDPITYPIEDI
ncbi:MAG: cyanophycin synthetase, partial [Candidatus Omnitrophota bacterium]